MRRSNLRWAIALSIVLHAVLLALVGPPPHGRAPLTPGREVVVEILDTQPAAVSAPPPKAGGEAVLSPEGAKGAGKASGVPRGSKPTRVATAPAEPRESGALQNGQSPPSPPGESSAPPADSGAALSDLPRAVPAGPSAAVGEQMVEQGSRGSRAYGSVSRNEQGEGPGRQALLDAERAVVKGRVDGWMADGAAEARVNGGIVDGYFGEMKQRLEARLDKPEGVLSGSFVRDFATAYGHAAQQYAAAGNPYRAGEVVGAAPDIDGDRPLATMAQRYPESTGGQGGGRARSALNQAAQRSAQGRMLRDFADGKFGKGLFAIVELRQGSDGHLLDAKLLEASGSAEFDAHVMKVAPQALTALGPPPATVKVSEGGLRSHWAFEGHVVYKRKLRDATLMQDGWYLALAGLAGLMTGDIDMGSDATFVDLRHPELKVKAKLLRIYP